MKIDKDVLGECFPSLLDQIGDMEVTGVAINSREVEPGSIFFAIIGENNNGHNYIESAIEKGAVAVIAQEGYKTPIDVAHVFVENTTKSLGKLAKAFWRKNKIPCVVITGSCGKTTVTSMLAGICEHAGDVLYPIKNYNNEYGLPLTIFSLEVNHKYAVFEIGTRNPGDLEYLTDICTPDVSLITNIAPVHIERFPNLDAIATEKAAVYRDLSSIGTAIVNADDVYAPYLLSNLKGQKVITFGIENPADVGCKEVKVYKNRLEFVAITPKGSIDIMVPCIGVHNVVNALAAIATSIAYGLSKDDISAGLANFRPKQQRLNILNGINDSTVIDDSYNANPLSMQASLSTLDSLPGDKKLLVMGDMTELGEHTESMHKLIGEHAKTLGIDEVLCFGDSSRFMCEVFGSGAKHFNDKVTLVEALKPKLTKGVTVLVKGSRSMKMEDVISEISQV